MLARTKLAAALAVVMVGALLGTSTRADDNPKKTTYLTFSAPVALPGVTLGTGTYIFELPEPEGAWNAVRVLSRDRSIIYYTGFTRPVNRPAGMSRAQAITFAEAQPNVARPIAVWWPQNESTGRQFVYAKR